MKSRRVRNTIAAAFCVILFRAGAWADLPAKNSAEVDRQLAHVDCAHALEDALHGWGALREWKVFPSTTDGTRIYATPTREIGKWVQVEVFGDGTVRATKRAPAEKLATTWARGSCVPAVKLIPTPRDAEYLAHQFTDDDLSAIVRKGGRGIVFAWSPNMEFSLKAYENARAAAKKLGIDFHAVLDPNADPAFAETRAKQAHLPKEALRKAESLELLLRGMGNHYPAVQAYGDGKVIGFVYPGLATIDQYIEFLRRRLGESQDGGR